MNNVTTAQDNKAMAVLDALNMARDKPHRRVKLKPEAIDGFCDPQYCVDFTDFDVYDNKGWVSSSQYDVTPEYLSRGWEIRFSVNGNRFEVSKVKGSVSIYCVN